MLKKISDVKTKFAATFSSFLSALGIGGGTGTAVCQTTCSTSSAVLPIFGISLSATPLAFLEDYRIFIWWVAFSFLILLIFFYVKGISKSPADRAFLVINTGLLTIGFPYFKYFFPVKVFFWVGLVIFGTGIFLLLKSKNYVIKFES